MSLTELAVSRPTAIAVAVIIALGAGVFGYLNLGADLFPAANTPILSVRTIYAGASPADIESAVVRPIEDAVSGIAGIDKIRSGSGEGVGYSILQFKLDVDINAAVVDVQKALDRIVDQLPKDAERPVLHKFSLSEVPVVILALSGSLPRRELHNQADSLAKRIQNLAGVGTVTLQADDAQQLAITLDKQKLEFYNVAVSTVLDIIQSANLNLPAGPLKQERYDRAVRVIGEFASLEDIRDLAIPVGAGTWVRLADLAAVELRYPDPRTLIRWNGTASIGISVQKQTDANAVTVANAIKRLADETRAQLPAGVELGIASDGTTFINQSLDETRDSLLQAIGTTALVLLLFLRGWKTSLIVLVSIPISLIATFFMMFTSHFTLNIVSLMALALCIGILVDDSIVILENITRHLAMGKSPRVAAIDGRREIGMAAIAITLCDVVVFAPVAFMSDLVGQFFRQFGLTVVCATLLSLLVSFTLTPLLAARLLGRPKRAKPGGPSRAGEMPGDGTADGLAGPGAGAATNTAGGIGLAEAGGLATTASAGAAAAEANAATTASAGPAGHLAAHERELSGGRLMEALRRTYRLALAWALGHRLAFVLGVLALFAAAVALVPLGAINIEFLPTFDQSKIIVNLNLGAGATLASTDAKVAEAEAWLKARPEVEAVYSTIGSSGGVSRAELIVRLKERSKRARGQGQIAGELRVWGQGFAGANVSVTEPGFLAQQSVDGTKPLIINLQGPNRERLGIYAARLEAMLKATPGIVDIDNSASSGGSEIAIEIDRLAASRFGVTTLDVARVLRTALTGSKAGVYRHAGEEYDLLVRFDPGMLRTPWDLDSIIISGRAGNRVPLGQIARFRSSDSALTLLRADRQNTITLQANLQGIVLGQAVALIQAQVPELGLPAGYQVAFTGDTSMMKGAFGSLAWALGASIGLVYLILVVLYQSWLTPLIRLMALPVGIIGGLGLLALTGKAVNIMTFVGIIMLDGLVSKNGTLLIDYTNTLMKRGLPLREALAEAGSTRLRPILMTSSTMVMGMLPLALAAGAGAEIKSGMAVVLIGGLLSSTLLSPLFLPVVYTLLDDLRRRLKPKGDAP